MTPSTHSLPLSRNLHVLLRRAAAGLAALRRWRPSRIRRRPRYVASLDELGTHLLRDINVPGGAYGQTRERSELESYDRARANRVFENYL